MRFESGPRGWSVGGAKTGCLGCAITALVLGATALCGGAVVGGLSLQRRGPDAAAVAAAQDCPAVVAALGRPVVQGVGYDFGPDHEGQSGGCNQATYGVEVRGSEGSGYARYVAGWNGEAWVIQGMSVEVAGASIQAVPCAPDHAPSGGKQPVRRRR